MRAEMSRRYYITTPIYYVNSVPHIGTALTTVAADVNARYQRMRGREVFFLTGTDENATKVAEAAEAAGKTPKEFVDEISEEFKRIWAGLNIRYDDFIRTTEERHIKVVEEVWRRLLEAGHIYPGEYKGWYDVTTETLYSESELVDGKSPDGNPVREVSEPGYYFRLSAFAEPLLEHIEKNPRFIIPETRKNEVVSFIKQGLRDVYITRENKGWGIPVPGDESRVIYVWFDALINYISAVGWPDGDWESYWPAAAQWMGKDILVRFHATIWPAMLMGLGLPLPETLIGHGWVLMGDKKISKSLGNVVRPLELAEELDRSAGCGPELAVDAVRWHMVRTMPFENDTAFSMEEFQGRYNSELVNILSNGVHRVVSMTHNFCSGTVPDGALDEAALSQVRDALARYHAEMEAFRFDRAMDAAVEVGRILNGYIDEKKPWDLRKQDDSRLSDVMRTMVWMVRAVEAVLRPVTPTVADRLAALLNLEPLAEFSVLDGDAGVTPGLKLAQPQPLYVRLSAQKKEEGKEVREQPTQSQSSPADDTITIEDFLKVKLRIARVLDAAPVEGADKLMRLELIVGDERRQVLAGIRPQYSPEDLIGRQVVLVANLAPRKMRGYESQGMILAADGPNGEAILLQPDKEAPDGTSVH
ncbi:MAG: methionine--tRNA ligase [Armatimonadetes bacterium]|nr:MAG: methionine--tRNA ligase [Armatimonadota bacterium]